MEAMKPLRQVFDDIYYAWELLQNQVRLELSDSITGEDISYLLQLYMRGVEKMNSLVDIRQSFFKNRVTSLMSRQSVIKILNKPMNKKNKVQQIDISSPVKKIDSKKQLQLQEKRKQIEMRLAYGAEEHSPQVLRKMMAQHTQKQSIIQSRIEKIMDSHEQRLAKRIRERKLRTLTAKSRSDIYMNDVNQYNGFSKKQLMEKNRDEEQFGGNFAIKQEQPIKKMKSVDSKRKHKSLQPKRSQIKQQFESPSKARRISVDFKSISLTKQFEKQ